MFVVHFRVCKFTIHHTDRPRRSPSAGDPQVPRFYPVTTHHRQSRMYLQSPMAEQVRRASAQLPESSQDSASTLPRVRDRPTPNMDPFATPARGPSQAIIAARNLPPVQIPTLGQFTAITLQPGQPIPGTIPSPTGQMPPLRTRRESHPFCHSPIFPKRVLKDTSIYQNLMTGMRTRCTGPISTVTAIPRCSL